MAAPELTRPDGSPLRALVVDDEVNIAELIAMDRATRAGRLPQAHTGTKAVAAARETKVDAVVLDMMLPDFDGLEGCGARRGRPSIPVLFLTARDAVEDRVAGLTAGGDDYVTKPLSRGGRRRLRAPVRRAGAQRPRRRRCSPSAT